MTAMPRMTTIGNHNEASTNWGHASSSVMSPSWMAARLTCIELRTTEQMAKTVMIGAKVCSKKEPHWG